MAGTLNKAYGYGIAILKGYVQYLFLKGSISCMFHLLLFNLHCQQLIFPYDISQAFRIAQRLLEKS